jgi:hypothetical protein
MFFDKFFYLFSSTVSVDAISFNPMSGTTPNTHSKILHSKSEGLHCGERLIELVNVFAGRLRRGVGQLLGLANQILKCHRRPPLNVSPKSK